MSWLVKKRSISWLAKRATIRGFVSQEKGVLAPTLLRSGLFLVLVVYDDEDTVATFMMDDLAPDTVNQAVLQFAAKGTVDDAWFTIGALASDWIIADVDSVANESIRTAILDLSATWNISKSNGVFWATWGTTR